MYSDVFCKVYNEFGWNAYPEAFGQELLHWMHVNHIPIRSSMDLGCGTGILCDLLSQQGIAASGTDLSESMIRVARENFPQLDFEVADMVTYRPDAQYDLVTCTGDALNHIHSLSDIQHIFRNVYHYLAPGGYFLFDILNENEVSPCEPFDCPFSDTIRAEFQISMEGRKIHLITKVFENGVFRFQEDICEILHDPQDICNLLRQAGFQVLRCADTLLSDGPSSTTWYILAQKNGGSS